MLEPASELTKLTKLTKPARLERATVGHQVDEA